MTELQRLSGWVGDNGGNYPYKCGSCGKFPRKLPELQKFIFVNHDELESLLNDVYQLITGFSLDESWSDFDESVRQRVIKMQSDIEKIKGK